MQGRMKAIQLQFRRFLSNVHKSRREVFQFTPAECDKNVSVTIEDETVQVPLEVHPIGSFGPSLIPFDVGLLSCLACPISGDALEFDPERNILISPQIKIGFPINSAGMPIFLKRWAIQLSDT